MISSLISTVHNFLNLNVAVADAGGVAISADSVQAVIYACQEDGNIDVASARTVVLNEVAGRTGFYQAGVGVVDFAVGVYVVLFEVNIAAVGLGRSTDSFVVSPSGTAGIVGLPGITMVPGPIVNE